MINFLQNILIVPSFYCEKRCKYCFYYDKTNDRVQLDISTLLSKLDQVIQTIRPSNIAGLNIGGGGDISLLSVDYIDNYIHPLLIGVINMMLITIFLL